MGSLITLNVNKIGSHVRGVLKHFPEVAGAYLFGSTLGACRPDSDIDIGLVLENIQIANRELAQLEAVIANNLQHLDGHLYDISILDLKNSIFSFRVIKEGNLIYVRNFERVTDIVEQVSRRYAEVYPRYKMALEEIIAEVTQ